MPATKTEKTPAVQTETDAHAQEGARAAGGTFKPCSLTAALGPAVQADGITCHPQGETLHPGDMAQYLAVLNSEPEPLEELESTSAGLSRDAQRDLAQEEEQRDAADKHLSGRRQPKEDTLRLRHDPDAACQQGTGSPHKWRCCQRDSQQHTEHIVCPLRANRC